MSRNVEGHSAKLEKNIKCCQFVKFTFNLYNIFEEMCVYHQFFDDKAKGRISKRSSKKTNLTKFSKKTNISYAQVRVPIRRDKKCSFSGKFGVLCFFVTSVLRLALSPYHRRIGGSAILYSFGTYGRYRRNMHALYIVHGTIWQRVVAWFFLIFNAASIREKVQFVSGVQFLYDTINPDQLELPPFVLEYDVQVSLVRAQ